MKEAPEKVPNRTGLRYSAADKLKAVKFYLEEGYQVKAIARELGIGKSFLGKWIREYREKQGLTQSELADLVGVRRETIVNLERGRYNPSLKLAMDIAKVFHVTVEEIFSYTE